MICYLPPVQLQLYRGISYIQMLREHQLYRKTCINQEMHLVSADFALPPNYKWFSQMLYTQVKLKKKKFQAQFFRNVFLLI